jgi:hypothetical protein
MSFTARDAMGFRAAARRMRGVARSATRGASPIRGDIGQPAVRLRSMALRGNVHMANGMVRRGPLVVRGCRVRKKETIYGTKRDRN